MTQPALLSPPFPLPTPLPTPGASACPQSPFPTRQKENEIRSALGLLLGEGLPMTLGSTFLWETYSSRVFSRASSSSPQGRFSPASPFPLTTSSSVGLFSRPWKMATIYWTV